MRSSQSLARREIAQVEEIRFLQSFLPHSLKFRRGLSHDAKKFMLMTEIRRHHLLPAGLRMTNLSSLPSAGGVISFNQLNFKYTYRRQALEARIPKRGLKYLGSPRYVGQCVAPFLLNSGQAAVAATLLALKSYYKNVVLAVPEGLYWESAEFCRKLGIEYAAYAKAISRKHASVIGYVDSSTVAALKDSLQEMEKIDLLVVDTTCWDVNGKEMRLLEKELKKRPLICIRSHLKIDSLGAEYGSLGSLVTHFPGESDLVQEIASQVRLIGGACELDNVYPFLLNPEFHRINSGRNARLRRACREVVQGLFKTELPSGVVLHPFSHELFFYLEFSKKNYAKVEELKLELLRSLFRVSHLPFKECDSFGFDFVVFKLFRNQDAPWVMRVTAADFNDEECKILVQILQNWMGRL